MICERITNPTVNFITLKAGEAFIGINPNKDGFDCLLMAIEEIYLDSYRYNAVNLTNGDLVEIDDMDLVRKVECTIKYRV